LIGPFSAATARVDSKRANRRAAQPTAATTEAARRDQRVDGVWGMEAISAGG
jgi:outer membrane murein-binding lipoprotein Lpp